MLKDPQTLRVAEIVPQVVLMTPGEDPIMSAVNLGLGYSYLSNTTMSGKYAEALGAAVVVVERAFAGYLLTQGP
jgi:hypothetical protein